jgi:putative hydrolase of the HAD superfamily
VPVRAVIFDIGNVLECNPRTGWQKRWAERLHLEVDEFEQFLDRIWSPGSTGAATLAEIERQTAKGLGLDAMTTAALMSDAWAEYVGSLNVELADYFARLRPRYKTGVLSNSFVGAREREQEAYGFEDLCEVIVYSHEVGYLKPDHRIYRLICDRLAVVPEEAVLLDDVQVNADGARAIGMRAITFANNAQAIEELEAHLKDSSPSRMPRDTPRPAARPCSALPPPQLVREHGHRK